ncbi:hypothetical protein NQ317_004184 [Molorchus minor]|uniref:Reverse transcriptase n=1 Tax=Molorchus minor TaxID=1323400 RepID=A0ABQ9JCP1_9CUCU|nr:hypothetical protein NQ317_004184 [Molorchus minor]
MYRDGPFDIYELKTVTYGTTAASFLAIRCLFQLADENSEKYPKLANIIRTDFYVDDLLTGADEVDEAAEICSGVSAILKQGSDFSVIDFGEHENAKTLGITWNPVHDKLMYKISNDFDETRISKRNILSSIAQIFDLLGLLAPCVILAKILMQRLWLEKTTWDEIFPIKIYTFWHSTVVLGWLRQPANKLKTFISNRVAEIQELTISDKWRHVVSKHNPADIVSRGIKPKVLVNSIMWWKGPPFLSQDETNWPKSCSPSDNLPDMRKLKKTYL